MIYRILNSVFFLGLSFACFAQINASLQDKLEDHFKEAIFASSNITASVFDIESNKFIAGYRPKKVLVPASTLKLLTCFSGLKYLGEHYRFNTHIGYTGQIDYDGTLKGDLIIKAGGDPTLGSDKIQGAIAFELLLSEITTQILAKGINCIEGSIIVDESVFDSYPVSPSWQWNDLGNYYASGAWGLNIAENQYYIRFKGRNHLGHPAVIHQVYPHVPGLKLSNEVIIDSAHTGDNAYIFGGPFNLNKRVVGTIPKGEGLFTIKGSIPDPPAFFLFHLRAKLISANISVNKTITVYQADKRKTSAIMSVRSPHLSNIIQKALFDSNNLYTEAILKMTGLKERGQGSGQNGIAVIQKLLRSYKIPVKDLHFHDGSGLSARNLISSFVLAKFLSSITREYNVQSLIEFLPEGGKEGTVKHMFRNSSIQGHVWLKSGSMQAVQSYAGYIQAKSGKWVSFSIIVNGFQGNGSLIRSKLDRIIRDIYFSC